MALANAAWIMASRGKSVLVVDWDLEAPGLHLYYGAYLPVPDLSHGSGVLDMFSAFADAATSGTDVPEHLRALHAEHTNFDRYRVKLDHKFPDGGELHYIGPGRMDDDYANRLHEFDWGQFQASDDGKEFLEALRVRMHDSAYDYILIDSRTGFSDSAGVCTLMLPDTVVITLALNRQAIHGAHQIARRITCSTRHIRLHVLPMRVDHSEKYRFDRCVAEARQALDPHLDLTDEDDLATYWGEVEVPYQAFYAYGEELAVIEDNPHQDSSILASYVKAVARLTDGEVTGFRKVSDAEKAHYHHLLDSLRHRTTQLTEPQTLTIVHAPADLLWADWITEQLRPLGIDVVAHQPTDEPAAPLPASDYILALLSPHLEGTAAGQLVQRLNSDLPTGDKPIDQHVVRLRLGTGRLTTSHDWPGTADLATPTEEAARRILLARFGLRTGDEHQPAPLAGPRFPGRSPRVWNLSMPNAEFIGRDALLRALSTQFVFGSATQCPPQVLYGMKGVGKRQIALAYAHRYASQYDLVWWIPASQPDLARESLGELARALNRAAAGARTGEELPDLLDDLRQRRHAPRWLLVFDGAESQESIEAFIPSGGTGHVLITSASPRWSPQFATTHRVDVFTPEESLALLCRRLPGAGEEELARLADRAGHLPLAEQWAAASLRRFPRAVDDYIAALDGGEALPHQDDPDSDYSAFARLHRQAFDALQTSSPAAARILELCAFLSPDGVGLNVILSKGMLAVLSGLEPELSDTLVLQNRVKSLDDHSLGVLDYRTRTLKVHRIVQDLIRGWMPEEDRETLRAQAQEVLAAMVPEDLDRHEPKYTEVFAELDRHVLACGAPESGAAKVHGWLVSQVYHRWTSGRWTAARDLGELVLRQWRSARGPDDIMVLRMESQVAAAYRLLGAYSDSLALSRHAVNTQRRLLPGRRGPELYTLLAARGYAADLRADGDFGQAYAEDRETYSKLTRLIGSPHNATLSAAHNLAWSKYFIESAEAAARQQESTYDLRRQVMPQDDPWTWVAYGDLGTFYREAGQPEASEQYLMEARNQLNAIEGERSPRTLGVVASLGLTMIRLGQVQHGQPLLQDAHVGFRNQWGENHPSTMACHTAVAIGLYAEGRATEAAEYIREELDRYVAVFGDNHPFTGICRNNLALYLLGRPETYEEAAEHARKAVRQLREAFGRPHRYTLVARMNQNNCLTALGESTSVECATEDEDIYEGCRKASAWGARHPVTLTAMANLLSSRPEAHQELKPVLQRRVNEYFLEGHPLAQALLAAPYRRTGADLEVQSV